MTCFNNAYALISQSHILCYALTQQVGQKVCMTFSLL